MPSAHPRRSRANSLLGGAHELGQNFLVDRRFTTVMADILRHAPPYSVLELGAGAGALTEALVRAGLQVTAVELDPDHVRRLRQRFGGRAEITAADMLTFVYGGGSHHVISNVPFGITTPFLRHLLPQPDWHTAVLLVQWEVARKRAGVGGTSMLTASWWPWYEFILDRRVPSASFRPPPAVDGGILVIRRRDVAELSLDERRDYQQFVRNIFTGPGRGLAQILSRHLPAANVSAWLRQENLAERALPRDLSANQWTSIYRHHTKKRTRQPPTATRKAGHST